MKNLILVKITATIAAFALQGLFCRMWHIGRFPQQRGTAIHQYSHGQSPSSTRNGQRGETPSEAILDWQ